MTARVRPEPFNRIRQGRRKRVANECHDNRVARDADPLLDQISAAGAGIGDIAFGRVYVDPAYPLALCPIGMRRHRAGKDSADIGVRVIGQKMMADSTRADPA